MSDYFTKLWSGKTYHKFRDNIAKLTGIIGAKTKNTAKKIESYTKDIVVGGNWFEQMGIHYYGPIDGHDFDMLLPVLENLKENETNPVLLHIVTQKGKGYAPAEASKDKYHGVSKFDPLTGVQKKSLGGNASYTSIFAEALINLAKKDEKIVAITAAMPGGTGVGEFEKHFPDRSFDVGIAEQHAVTFAAGMATEGYKPFCAIYSTFLQRAYDQIVHDVAIQSLPVKFMIDRAGLVGADGPTHAGSFDIAYLACLPNFILMAAANDQDLVDMVTTAASVTDKPVAVRYPRGSGIGMPLEKGSVLSIGKGEILQKGEKIAILSYGTRLPEAQKAAEGFYDEYGIQITLANAKFAKPLDGDLIEHLMDTHDVLLTLEEGSRGGFGSLTLEYAQEKNILHKATIKVMTLPDYFMDQDTHENMYAEAGLGKEAILDQLTILYNAQK